MIFPKCRRALQLTATLDVKLDVIYLVIYYYTPSGKVFFVHNIVVHHTPYL